MGLLKDVEHEYTYTASKDLNAWFRASPYYLGRDQPIPQLDLPWERFPKELRPGGLKKRKTSNKKVKPNLSKRSKEDLKKLEELGKKEAKDSDDDDKKSDIASGEEDAEDEEMDGGTDYASNYFDNGEGYGDDEDDNADE